jgi:hypothetical protein
MREYIKLSETFCELLSNDTAEFYSEIAISLNFTAEHTENAEPSGKSVRIETVLKLCVLGALRGG